MRTLIVEDEPVLAESLRRGLRQAAHAADVAGTLEVARRKLALESYDALVLDVGLPDGSGMAFARELRERGVTTPILMLTARDSVDDRVRGLDHGADDYLVKPFALEELVARLRALQRRTPVSRAPGLTVGDLSLDPATRSATRAGEAITLTTTEYALLEFLALRAGQVVTRADISAHVWDENYDPFSNVIDVYVARLRRKVDRAELRPMVRTVRGRGYALDPAGAA
jgi:two-component system copper resistance phosphate regulon response regulator CusR